MFDKELMEQLDQAASRAAETEARTTGDIAGLWRRLSALDQQKDLPDLLEQARRAHWSGAIPVPFEAPGKSYKTPDGPMPVITGIDGSQIYPHDSEPVVWGYARAQAVRMGKPFEFEETRFLEEEELVDRDGYLLRHVVDAVRTHLEMKAAARAAEIWPQDLALLDGNLLPFTGVARQQNNVAADALYGIIAALVQCRSTLVAGLVSSPRSRLIINLIRLADGDLDPHSGRHGVRDIDLMRHGLAVGERSSVFLHGSPRNDSFQAADAGIYFFFLRISHSEVARVEVPVWVAVDPHRLGQVHAALLEDSKALNYPYLLARAHDSVVIRQEVAAALQERTLHRFLAKGGQPLPISAKNAFKKA